MHEGNILKQNISSSLALLLVAVLSIAVAWITLRTATQVAEDAENFSQFNIQKRIQENGGLLEDEYMPEGEFTDY